VDFIRLKIYILPNSISDKVQIDPPKSPLTRGTFSRIVFPDSLLPTPYSLFPTPYSLFPVPDSRFPIPDSLLPAPYSLLPAP